MARAKKVNLISKGGKKVLKSKEEADKMLAWCKDNNKVGLWKIDESDKKENE